MKPQASLIPVLTLAAAFGISRGSSVASRPRVKDRQNSKNNSPQLIQVRARPHNQAKVMLPDKPAPPIRTAPRFVDVSGQVRTTPTP